MAKTKKKEQQKKESVKSRVRKEDVLPENLSKGENDHETLILWGEAVDSLAEREFGSLQEATQAVIDTVLERLHGKNLEPKGVREFLTKMFESDPSFEDEMREILHIK